MRTNNRYLTYVDHEREKYLASDDQEAHPFLRLTICSGIVYGTGYEHSGGLYQWPGRPTQEYSGTHDKYLPASMYRTVCDIRIQMLFTSHPEDIFS